MEMNNTPGMNPYLVPVAIVLAGLFIGGAVVWNGMRPAGTANNDAVVTVDIKDVKTDGVPFIGNPNAPITVAFWSDFQCPFCKAFEVGHPQVATPPALPEIIKNFVDTGKVKVIFKDVVFLSPRMGMDSQTGVEYSLAVWKLYPELYFTWRTAVFEAQDEEGAGFGDAKSIDALNATIAGIDAAKVAADVIANKAAYDAVAQATTQEAQKLGVRATPSFIVGKQLIEGAQPYAAIAPAIEELIK